MAAGPPQHVLGGNPLHVARSVAQVLTPPAIRSPYQWGTVTAISSDGSNTISVELDGATTATTGVRYLATYNPAVGDVVFVSRGTSGRTDRVVAGKLADNTPYTYTNKSAPTNGTYPTGALVTDIGYLGSWLCTAGGSPGTWKLLSANALVCRAHLTAGQSIANATDPTKVLLDTVDWDPNSNFDRTTNHQYTCPVPGYYLVSTASRLLSVSTGSNGFHVEILKNGSIVDRGGDSSLAATGNFPGAAVTDRLKCVANDTIAMGVGQFSGAAQNLENSSLTFLAIKFDGQY